MSAVADAAPPKEKKAKKERKLSVFVAFARVKGGDGTWTQLPVSYDAVTQDHAKKAAAHSLENVADDHPLVAFRDALAETGPGLELAAVSARVWQPLPIQVKPQPSKLVLGS